MPKLAPFTLLLLSCIAAGCATQAPSRKDPRDPFERVNRATFAFNEAIDRAVAKPVARAYRRVTPQPIETGISNFMDNISYPIVIVNDVLQGKFVPALRDTGRFLLNSTLGLGGFLDPATAAGLEKNDEDFGQTLGVWGVPSGPYLVLPFLGPATVRDGIGDIVDEFADPRHYIKDDELRYAILALRLVDTRARLLDVEGVLDQAYDRYSVLRSVYLQRREYLVHDGDVPQEDVEAELLRELEEDQPADEDPEAPDTGGEPADEPPGSPPQGD